MRLPSIPEFDKETAQKAADRQDKLTKPRGSLGVLEELSIRLAGIKGEEYPSLINKAVIVMAGDHGIALEGVSAYPAEVTPQMVLNFLKGGAAINVLSRQANARVVIVDIGVAYDFGEVPGLLNRKIAAGTRNMAIMPAMTREQAEQALQAGIDVINGEREKGLDIVATGEMGIGNTTPSSAITSIICGMPVKQVTGRGTGIDDSGLAHKISIIEKALSLHQPDPQDPIDVLSKVGGFEIAGLAGVIIGAAANRIPVVLDGFISSAAALIAAGLAPGIEYNLIASHQSVEIGHQVILQKLGLTPLFDLGLRLGEGSGAALAFPILDSAVRVLKEMATFADAGVTDKG
jgi:nicotinate-nucleotide--dimethylbenzimidazole phosphoribosyltransferase